MYGTTAAAFAWLFGAGLSFAVAPRIRNIAWRFGVLDHPSTPLKLQSTPVAYLGGAVVFLPVVSAWIFVASDSALHRSTLAYAFGLLILGLADDIWSLRPRSKLVGQLLLALIPSLSGCRLNLVPHLASLDVVLTVVWLVTCMNAFNMVDVLDGLAASLGAVAALTASILAALHDQESALILAGSLSGACFGFLRVNRSPASMYLGDAGSLLIGGVLGQFALEVAPADGGAIRWAIMAALLAVPLLDLALVTVARLGAGRPIYLGSTDHFALRLRKLGIRPYAIVMVAAMFQALLSMGVLYALANPALRAALLLASSALVLSVLLLLLGLPAPKQAGLERVSRAREGSGSDHRA